MKRLTFVLLVLSLSAVAFADETVRGYTRRDGTYVAPHQQTSPNQYRYDNYSSQGNTNPYTGQRGYERNEYSTPPVYNRSNPNSGYSNPSSGYGSSYGQQQRRRSTYGND